MEEEAFMAPYGALMAASPCHNVSYEHRVDDEGAHVLFAVRCGVLGGLVGAVIALLRPR